MGTPYYTKTLVLLMVIVSACSLMAQDIHFTQFGNSHLNLNPALTGSFNGKARVNMNYRSQWTEVPVSYETITGAVDLHFSNDCIESPWSVGLLFNRDIAGDSKLSFTHLELAGSYRQQLSATNFIMFGAMLGYMQRSFDPANLRWDVQFDGKQYDQFINGETFVDESRSMVDFSAGFNWHVQGATRTVSATQSSGANGPGATTTARPKYAFDFGAALFHINQPNTSFFGDDDVNLRSRISLYGLGALSLSSRLDLTLNAMAQFQGVYREALLNAGIRAYLNSTPQDLLALEFGLTYRFGDAFAPGLQILYKGWRAGFTYDINTSPFNKATNRNGGPEFSIRYIIQGKGCPPCYSCPTYL